MVQRVDDECSHCGIRHGKQVLLNTRTHTHAQTYTHTHTRRYTQHIVLVIYVSSCPSRIIEHIQSVHLLYDHAKHNMQISFYGTGMEEVPKGERRMTSSPLLPRRGRRVPPRTRLRAKSSQVTISSLVKSKKVAISTRG